MLFPERPAFAALCDCHSGAAKSFYYGGDYDAPEPCCRYTDCVGYLNAQIIANAQCASNKAQQLQKRFQICQKCNKVHLHCIGVYLQHYFLRRDYPETFSNGRMPQVTTKIMISVEKKKYSVYSEKKY